MAWLIGKTSDFCREEYEKAYKTLSPSRKAKIDRLKKTEDKKRSLACELLIKKLLSSKNKSFLSVDAAENGCPFLRGSQLSISLSHCEDRVACAFSEDRVGIDIEKLTEKNDIDIKNFAKRYFVENEIALLEREGYSSLAFYKIWTGKEAYSKMLGSALSKNLKIDTTTLDIETFVEGEYVLSVATNKI